VTEEQGEKNWRNNEWSTWKTFRLWKQGQEKVGSHCMFTQQSNVLGEALLVWLAAELLLWFQVNN